MEKGRPLISISTVWLIWKFVLARRPESGDRRVERALVSPARGPPESSRPRTDPWKGNPSPADSELVDDRAVPFGVLVLEVLEEAPALADEHQETPPGVVVLAVLLEVIGQPVDSLRQECDLDLGRSGVPLVDAELLDQALLLVNRQRHGKASWQSPRPREPRSTGTGSKTAVFVGRYEPYHGAYWK